MDHYVFGTWRDNLWLRYGENPVTTEESLNKRIVRLRRMGAGGCTVVATSEKLSLPKEVNEDFFQEFLDRKRGTVRRVDLGNFDKKEEPYLSR